MEWDNSSSAGAWGVQQLQSLSPPQQQQEGDCHMSGTAMAMRESSKRAADSKLNRGTTPSKSDRMKENLEMFRPPSRKSTVTSLPTEPTLRSNKPFQPKATKERKTLVAAAAAAAATAGRPSTGNSRKTGAPTGMPSRAGWYVGKMRSIKLT